VSARNAGGGSTGLASRLASGLASGFASGLGMVIILPQAVHLAFCARGFDTRWINLILFPALLTYNDHLSLPLYVFKRSPQVLRVAQYPFSLILRTMACLNATLLSSRWISRDRLSTSSGARRVGKRVTLWPRSFAASSIRIWARGPMARGQFSLQGVHEISIHGGNRLGHLLR